MSTLSFSSFLILLSSENIGALYQCLSVHIDYPKAGARLSEANINGYGRICPLWFSLFEILKHFPSWKREQPQTNFDHIYLDTIQTAEENIQHLFSQWLRAWSLNIGIISKNAREGERQRWERETELERKMSRERVSKRKRESKCLLLKVTVVGL